MLNEIIVDVFAGGGGASSSIACAVGRSVDVAIDHDPAAIVMHRANHPHTKHLLQPIGGYTMNLEGKIVFISGAITGVDGYAKYKEDEALSKTLAALYRTDKWKENT